MTGHVDLRALVAGVLFVVAGVVFGLEQLGVITLSAGIVWPLLVVGLGLAMVAGAVRQAR
jgi:hypothetical protein